MIDTGYLLTHLIYPYFLANDYSFDHSDTGSDHEVFYVGGSVIDKLNGAPLAQRASYLALTVLSLGQWRR